MSFGRRHDGLARSLPDRSLRRSIMVVADHTVTTYDGDLDDYRRMVLSARGMRSEFARPRWQ